MSPATESASPVAVRVALLTAVADPVRWAVLRRLADGRACVCDLQAEAEVSPNLLS
jgi:ArsR family transcriptional regulator, arsenate/arsenite/antimonite-responsive transcriptional repressor